MIDIHTHILPGFDDGARDFDEALAMLAEAEADGIGCIVGTPHFIPGSFAPHGKEVKEACHELSERAAENKISTKISCAHEIRAGAGLIPRIKSGEILAYGDKSRYLLLEMPPVDIPIWMDQMLFELELEDMTPIIAHPERNRGVHKNPMRLYELIQKGCMIQITASSLLGYFGEATKLLAEKLLRNGFVHFVASDAHDSEERKPKLSKAYLKVEELCGKDSAEKLFRTHPKMALAGESIIVPEPIPIESEPEDFLSRIFGVRKG